MDNGFFVLDLFAQNATGSITVRVTGDNDPGYGTTAKMLAESALCLAQDFPGEGKPGIDEAGRATDTIRAGVMTPAAAMGQRLIERLEARAGMTFTVLEDNSESA